MSGLFDDDNPWNVDALNPEDRARWYAARDAFWAQVHTLAPSPKRKLDRISFEDRIAAIFAKRREPGQEG